MKKKLQNQWIVNNLEDLHNGIAEALAFSEKTDPIKAYSAFMNHVDKLIDKIYKKEGIERPVYKLNEKDWK